jgi:uncharacterized membrane protein YbhN (UPF0104 family)
MFYRYGGVGRVWRILIKLGISTGLMWLVLRQQDFAGLLGQILLIDRYTLPVSLVLVYGFITVLAMRWATVLKALGTPWTLRNTFSVVMIGQFFSQVLPSGVGGDMVRAWLAHDSGVRLSVAIASVMIDRLAGLLVLLILVTAGLPALLHIHPGADAVGGTVIVLVCGYFGLGLVLFFNSLPAALDRFRLARSLRQFAIRARTALLRPATVIPILFYGLINQIGVVLVVYILAQGLGLSVSFTSCLLVVPLSNLVQILPISVAGWGLREGFFVAMFRFFDVGADKALALSMVFGILILVASLPGGVIWLLRKRATDQEARLPIGVPLAHSGYNRIETG